MDKDVNGLEGWSMLLEEVPAFAVDLVNLMRIELVKGNPSMIGVAADASAWGCHGSCCYWPSSVYL